MRVAVRQIPCQLPPGSREGVYTRRAEALSVPDLTLHEEGLKRLVAPTFRSLVSFGKRQEFVAIGELLRRGYDVYQTLVDDQGIDCVVRKEVDGIPKYIDLQVKARSSATVPRDWAFFNLGSLDRARGNYLFLFYAERTGTYWVIPSERLRKEAYRKKSGKHVGDHTIRLGSPSRTSFRPRPRFREFEGEAGFCLLESTFDKI